jgi:hypothetical protein
MKSLSNHEIKAFFNGDINLILYPDIKDIKNIQQLLGKYNRCVILYLTSQNYGHWCCIFLDNNSELHFFDSYGIMPDCELKFIDNDERTELNQKVPYLSKLIIKSGYITNYNNYKFQKEDPNITSCGYHCIMRLCFSDLTDEQYKDLIYSFGSDADKTVVKFITPLISQ